jgi:hypothetical protein
MIGSFRRRGLAVAGVLVATIATLPAAAPAFAASAGPYQVKFAHSGKCMDDTAGSITDGTPIQQWECAGATAWNATFQEWSFDWTDNGFARLRNHRSGKCLNVQGRSTADGAAVIQFTCGQASGNDEWKGEYVTTLGDGDDYYRLRARHSAKCLDVTGGVESVDNGVRLQQYGCVPFKLNQMVTWYLLN